MRNINYSVLDEKAKWEIIVKSVSIYKVSKFKHYVFCLFFHGKLIMWLVLIEKQVVRNIIYIVKIVF